MANSTSKTTKAKTKTTKKSVVASKKVTTKAVKQPVKAVRAPLKTTSKKVVGNEVGASAISRDDARKAAAASRKFMGRLLTAEGLCRLYLVNAVVFLILALLAALFMNDTAYQLLRGHLTADTLASQGQTVFGPAQHVITSLEVRWLVVITMLVSAALAAWRYQNVAHERQALASRISPWRWVDVALTGALMVQVVAFLSGMQEVVSLMLLGALVASSAVFAWIAERENAEAPRVVRGALLASLVTGVLAYLAIFSYAVATPIYGMVRSPWYVYALYALAVATAATFVFIQVRQLRRVGEWANYAFVERNYGLLNLVAKVLFAAILIIGLHQ